MLEQSPGNSADHAASCRITPAVIGPPAYSQTLPSEAQSAGRARRLVTTAVYAWNLPQLAAPAGLVASELVGNAVLHSSSSSVRVTVSRPGPRLVLVVVADRSQVRPAPRQASGEDERGRGLAIVTALSVKWGTDLLSTGKAVWAELRASDDS